MAAPVEEGGPTLPLWGRVVTYGLLVVCFVLLCCERVDRLSNQIYQRRQDSSKFIKELDLPVSRSFCRFTKTSSAREQATWAELGRALAEAAEVTSGVASVIGNLLVFGQALRA